MAVWKTKEKHQLKKKLGNEMRAPTVFTQNKTTTYVCIHTLIYRLVRARSYSFFKLLVCILIEDYMCANLIDVFKLPKRIIFKISWSSA
mgnify:CR=1 FL=1